jgi:hypothetical protein
VEAEDISAKCIAMAREAMRASRGIGGLGEALPDAGEYEVD